jgi:GT2 family glycosyltransferase
MSTYKNPQRDSIVSTNVFSARSARQLIARCMPERVKTNLKTGFTASAIAAIHRLRARIITQSLSSNKVFEQSARDKQAGATMSLVVPIHDAPLVTKRCLASLERYASEAEIILVDDASELKETIAIIREYSSRNGWRVISNVQASGHSAATKTGAEFATRPYLCLLNSDTVVTPWCWRAIQAAFETDPKIGVAGPCTSRSATRQVINVARDCRFEWNDNQICAFAKRLTGTFFQRSIVDLPWIGGFALFIRGSLWQELDGFDPNLTDYANEIELCKRVKDSGYRTVWARRGYIHHFGAQSYGQVISHDELHQRKLAAVHYVRRKHS